MKLRGASKYGPVVFIFCLFLYLFHWSHSGSWLITSISEFQQDWQPVIGSQSRFAVYSAYSFVNRTSSKVLLIGITKPGSKDEIRCHFHFSNQPLNQSTEVAWKDLVPGSIETLQPGITDRYAGVFVRCPLPLGRPKMVSLLLNSNTTLTNWVRIQYGDESEDAPYQYTFSLCVKPTFNFNNVLRLLEWIEFYKLMGVEQFTFYNMSIGPEASCILNALANGRDSSIKVNVLPWRNHDLLDGEQLSGNGNIPQYSLGVAQNECVYRHRGRRTKYMALVDLDEFIMPRENVSTNYRELMPLLEFQNGTEIGGYIFQNAFYVLSRPDNPMLLEWCSELEDPLRHHICNESLVMKKVWREADLFEHRHRSKFIIKPEGVKIVSSHFVERFEEGYVNLNVPGSVATVRHYRKLKKGNGKTEDGISKEFGLKLVDELSKSVEPFMELCNLTLDSIGK